MLLAVRDGAHLTTIEGGRIAVLARNGAMATAPGAGSPEAHALARLLEGPAPAATLDDIAAAAGPTGLARWMLWSGRAWNRGLLVCRMANADGTTLADIVPLTAAAPDLSRADPASSTSDERLQLSRFAMLRRRDGALVLESPLAAVRVELSAPAAAIVTMADGVRTLDEMAATAPDPDAARVLLVALIVCGLVGAVGVDGLLEEEHPALVQWELHDLVMHSRTRTARADDPRGSTFRFADERPAPPALRHRAGSASIALARPELERLLDQDVPLARAMEERRSRRRLGPLHAESLGELLYRTVRVRGEIPGGEDPRAYPRTDRPYPAAGAMYELITYLAVSDCDGVPAGLYRYDPVGHGLDLVAPAGPAVDRLLDDARAASAAESRPSVLVLLAADFSRLSWKYEGIAYAATLKNVGVLFATMQLVATAMGLGSCPLGGGNSDAFAAATGLHPLEESSVGELMLGA